MKIAGIYSSSNLGTQIAFLICCPNPETGLLKNCTSVLREKKNAQMTNIDKSIKLHSRERNYHVQETELVELYLIIATEKLPSFPIIALSEVSESQPAAGAGHLMYFLASWGTCRLQRVSARLLKSNSAYLGYPNVPEDLLVYLPEVANSPFVRGANSPFSH